jgi:transposase
MSGMNAYPLALRARIVSDYQAGATYEELAERFDVSYSSVRKYVTLFKKSGSVKPHPHKGRLHQKLNTEQREVLRQLRMEHPQAEQQELADRLFEATGVRIVSSTVSRYLRRLGFARRSAKVPWKAQHEAASKGSGEPRRYRKAEPPPPQPHRKAYPSDLSDAEWLLLSPLIPKAKPGGHKEVHAKREIVNAMLYLLRSGCQWRMLPHDFPPWQSIYNYYLEWRDNGLWDRIAYSGAKRSPIPGQTDR